MVKIRLPNGKWINLNEQQSEALDMIDKWFGNKLPMPDAPGNHLLFRLSGYAGTGKTTISKEAVEQYLNKNKWNKGVAVTAPTHKAKKVIADATGLDANTIQALVGLAPNTDVLDFDINNPAFELINKPKISDYSAILIDEASMLNTPLFEVLVKLATQFNVKILFMADKAQLPPVGESISPIFTSPLITFFYELNKVERQTGDNPLMSIYDKIRDAPHSLTDVFEHKTLLIEQPKPAFVFEDYALEERAASDEEEMNHRLDRYNTIKPIVMGAEFMGDLNAFGSKVVTAFYSEKFAKDANYCKLFCWTNDRVKFWNDSIRRVLVLNLRKDITDPLLLAERIHDEVIMENELLLGYSNYKGGIANAGEYRVVEIEYITETMEFGKLNEDTGEREFQVDVNVYKVVLQDVDAERKPIETTIVEPTATNYQQYLVAFNWYLSQGKFQRRWSMYFQWKEKYLLLTDIKSTDGKLIVKKDLDYGYALSVHKCQGSTYEHVFIDENNIDKLESRPFCEFLMKTDREDAKKQQWAWRKELEKLKTTDTFKYNQMKDAPDPLQVFDKLYPNFDAYYKQKQTEKNSLKYVGLSRPKYRATIFSSKTVS